MLEWIDVECVEPHDWEVPRVPTVSWICDHILPVLKASKVKRAWLIEDYANGVATEKSFITIMVEHDKEYELGPDYLWKFGSNLTRALGRMTVVTTFPLSDNDYSEDSLAVKIYG